MNGVPCRECGGSTRARGRRRMGWRVLAGRLATPAGVVVGTLLNWSRTVPGVGGAAGVAYGIAAVAHGLVPRIPELGAGLLIAGVFGLLIDRNTHQ